MYTVYCILGSSQWCVVYFCFNYFFKLGTFFIAELSVWPFSGGPALELAAWASVAACAYIGKKVAVAVINFLCLTKVTPNIPSRFTTTKRHIFAVAYVPVAVPPSSGSSERSGCPAWNLLPPPPGRSYTSIPEVQRVQMWCSGPRCTNPCIPGARRTVIIIILYSWLR